MSEWQLFFNREDWGIVRGLAFFSLQSQAMRILVVVLSVLVWTACNKASTPAASNGPAAVSPKGDAVQQKLLEYSGNGATVCGRLDMHAAEGQLKGASDCAMQAAQGKHAFYVAYDMPGMSVGIAGNAQGKLFTVQSQSGDGQAALTSNDCPSQLRVASSGRVSCFAPGDMGSMGGGHAGAPGMANPHGAEAAPPSNKQP